MRFARTSPALGRRAENRRQQWVRQTGMPVDGEIAIVQRVEQERRAERERARRGRWPEALATAACIGFVIVAPKSLTPAIRVAFVLMATAGAIDLSRPEGR